MISGHYEYLPALLCPAAADLAVRCMAHRQERVPQPSLRLAGRPTNPFRLYGPSMSCVPMAWTLIYPAANCMS